MDFGHQDPAGGVTRLLRSSASETLVKTKTTAPNSTLEHGMSEL